MRKYVLIVLTLTLLFTVSGFTQAISVLEIIKKVEDYNYANTTIMKADMVVIVGSKKITKSMTIQTLGTDKAFVEFTSAKDKGTKFLKLGDNLYMLFPSSEDVVQISGHMLNQGMMGSDYSYQDSLDNSKLSDLYDFTLLGEEEYQGRKCYVIDAIGKPNKKVSYYHRKQWIDQERFVLLKEELYAQGGKLMKVATVEEVKFISGRYYATKSVMENKLKKDCKTEFIVVEIQFDPQIANSVFTLENLRKR